MDNPALTTYPVIPVIASRWSPRAFDAERPAGHADRRLAVRGGRAGHRRRATSSPGDTSSASTSTKLTAPCWAVSPRAPALGRQRSSALPSRVQDHPQRPPQPALRPRRRASLENSSFRPYTWDCTATTWQASRQTRCAGPSACPTDSSR